MKLSKKKVAIVYAQLIAIIVSNVFASSKEMDIALYGMLFAVYSVFSFSCLVFLQKRLITPINILYMTFILFQTGVPIAYFIDSDYVNPYINLFGNNLVLSAARYTLWSIQAMSLVLVIAINLENNKKKKILFSKIGAINDKRYVYSVAKVMYIATSLIVVPLYTSVAFLTLLRGFSQEIRSLIAANAIFNLVRAFYCPSFFLLVCYGREKSFTKIAKYLFFFTCVMSLVSGNRTDGILWLITYFYYSQTDHKNKGKNQVVLTLGFIVIILLAVYIGQSRMSSGNVTLTSSFMNVIGEMGFNFMSICFVMSYVPAITSFKYGMTYLGSVLCMFPKTLDVLHILDTIRYNLPAQWLYDINHRRYGTLLDFGTGFSMIGETYMNFADFGFIICGVYALLLCQIFGGQWNKDSCWEKYVQMSLLLGFLTFPRRAMIELLNNIAYSIFFVAIILIVFYRSFEKENIV